MRSAPVMPSTQGCEILVELNVRRQPLPFIVMVFVADTPAAWVTLTCSTNGPPLTLTVTGDPTPWEVSAAANAVKVWTFVPPVASALLMVYAPLSCADRYPPVRPSKNVSILIVL